MTSNIGLRQEADGRRAVFFRSTSSVVESFRPVVVLDKIVGAFDPGFVLLDQCKSAAKRNPIAALAVVGGIWLLTRQLQRYDPNTKSATRQDRRSYRLTGATLGGNRNGYNNDAKQS